MIRFYLYTSCLSTLTTRIVSTRLHPDISDSFAVICRCPYHMQPVFGQRRSHGDPRRLCSPDWYQAGLPRPWDYSGHGVRSNQSILVSRMPPLLLKRAAQHVRDVVPSEVPSDRCHPIKTANLCARQKFRALFQLSDRSLADTTDTRTASRIFPESEMFNFSRQRSLLQHSFPRCVARCDRERESESSARILSRA